ncbi:MAG: zinc ribbon domain-containing protein, partial [Bacilli bacterium]|nr:zinc ribbon domain-containing protein [Bacilli bacterium]
KSEGFAVGLYFLTPIFSFILGVGSSEYMGPTPMKDPVGDWLLGLFGKENTTSYKKSPNESETRDTNGYSYTYSNHSSNNSSNVPNVEVLEETTVNYCKNCGSKVEPGENYCVGCGTKIN